MDIDQQLLALAGGVPLATVLAILIVFKKVGLITWGKNGGKKMSEETRKHLYSEDGTPKFKTTATCEKEHGSLVVEVQDVKHTALRQGTQITRVETMVEMLIRDKDMKPPPKHDE